MKNFYFIRTIPQFSLCMFFLFFLGLPFTAQEIITEHISKNLNGNIQYKPTFNENIYKKSTNKNGANIFIKNQNPTQNIPQIKDVKAVLPFTVNFNYDQSEYYISSFLIFN